MVRTVDPDKVTIMGKVAIALLAAEHVTPLFAAHPDTLRVVEEAIAAGWSWEQRRTPDPSRLYHEYNPILMEHELQFHNDERLLTAFHACLYAYHYLVWKAEGVASVEQPGVVFSIGNDIAEADETYLTECLSRTVQVSARPDETAKWLDDVIGKIERECAVRGNDVIGAPVARDAFTVPPID